MRILFLFLIGVASLHATETSKTYPQIKQPVDQTDIFAIPLDDDEEAQDEELNSLEHPKK